MSKPTPPKAHPIVTGAFRTDLIAGVVRLDLSEPARAKGPPLGGGLALTPRRGGNPIAAVCVLRAQLVLDAAGVVRVLDAAAVEDGEGLSRLLAASEQGMPHAEAHRLKLAHACGFPSFDGLWKALATGKLDRAGRARRDVVGWRVG